MVSVIAVDAGTTSVRSLLVDHDGTVAAVAQEGLAQHYPRPGWVEHDAEEIVALTMSTLAQVAAVARDSRRELAAVGITNQRETVVAFDRSSGAALHRAIVWQDRRTAERCRQLTEEGRLPLVRQRTGLVLDPYFSATKMEWLLHGPLATAAGSPTLALCTVDAWLLWRLTGGTDGGVYATDVTNASRTSLCDLASLRWDDELCELFSVPRRALPEIRPSSGRLGRLHPGVVGPDSPLKGVPVAGMAGDQHAALFGQACFEPAMTKVTYGTGSFALVNCGASPPEAPPGLVATVAFDLGTPGGRAYALEGSVFNSGSAIQWLRDGLGLLSEASETEALACSVPDAGGVSVVPAFTGLGSPWWDPRARGVVLGITKGVTRAHLARAVVEAMAFQVRDMADAMRAATGRPISQLRVDGGAAVMDLLLQLQADLLDTTVARPGSVETTALGAATLAGLAEGVWSGLDEASSLWRLQAEFSPEAPRELVEASYDRWRAAVERSRGWASP
jgi:glycerol kinase